ncbi:MAG: ZIP family metal transporter, partial [Acetobacterales bacterium]
CAGGHVAAGTSLAMGIGLQNVPEGLAVAVSLVAGGYSPLAAFGIGLFSGLVEPVGGLIGVGVVAVAQPLLPWGLGFAAGAMLFVTSQEVIPEIHQGRRSSLNTFGLMVGFVVMMMLDVVLG